MFSQVQPTHLTTNWSACQTGSELGIEHLLFVIKSKFGKANDELTPPLSAAVTVNPPD